VTPRIDPELNGPNASTPTLPPALALPPPLPVALDPDVELPNNLPSDHPPWAKDTLSLSQRARALLGRLRPIAIKVITFWDHRVRSILVGGRALSVDASGSYRLE
jgi:hypothetical protein